MDFLITNEALFYSFLLLLMLHVKHFLVNAIIVKPQTKKESLHLFEISAGLHGTIFQYSYMLLHGHSLSLNHLNVFLL